MKVSLAKCASVSSDNAKNANATSNKIKFRKADLIRRLQNATRDGATDEDRHGLDSDLLQWYSTSNGEFDELHVLHCTNHLVSLLAEKGYGKEAQIANIHRACMNPGTQLENSPSEYIYAVSKLLGDHGDHGAYYLNMNSGLKAYVHEVTETIAHDEAGAAVDDHNLACALPSVKGSRAFIEVQLATAILRNRVPYTGYLVEVKSQVVDDTKNKLIEKAFDGLRDAAVTHALKARAFRDIMLISPLVFFLNKLATRCEVRAVFDIALEFIARLENMQCNAASIPRMDAFAEMVLAKFPN